MRRIIILLVVSAFCHSSVKSERILETVYREGTPYFNSADLDGKVLIAESNQPYLLSYNDVTVTRFPFPIVDGVQMEYNTFYKNRLVNFESSVFFGLVAFPSLPSPHPEIRYLFKYTGGRFTRISSLRLASNCIVYRNSLYFVCHEAGIPKLFRYSRGVVAEVIGAAIPLGDNYDLHAPGSYLYITGSVGTPVNFIRRFDGTSFLTIAPPESSVFVHEVYEVPGTSRAYFHSGSRIHYYDGRTLHLVYHDSSPVQKNFKLWNNDLYFTANALIDFSEHEGRFYRLSGTVLTEISAPTGFQIGPGQYTNPEIYEGFIHVTARFSDNSTNLLRYNGSSFDNILTIPTPFLTFTYGAWLLQRDGKLIIQPNFKYGIHAFEYNGTDLTEIRGLPGETLGLYIGRTHCNYLWSIQNGGGPGHVDAYAEESRDCPPPTPPPPPPPPPPPIAVIPVDFMIHERFEGVAIGRDRGWCWNEIIFGWDPPICDPPCPEPNYQLLMVGENNEIAWAEKFSKPSKFTVPLKDEKPFKTILSSIDNKSDLLIFDPDLVPKGIEEIKILMYPKKNFIAFSVSTRKKEAVPLRVALLDEDGKEIWMQTFVAPLALQITATVQKAGKTLVFSIPDDPMKFITRRGDH